MIPYQVGRRASWQEHIKRKLELWEQQDHTCAVCHRKFQSPNNGVRHHPQMVSTGGIDLPGLGNEQWICNDCHKMIHPWLTMVV